MAFKDYKPVDITKQCMHREHNPPSHIVLQPGTHNWQCPKCGHITTFVVQNPSLMLHQDNLVNKLIENLVA